MTEATLDALALELANEPEDESSLAAFVDLLKDAPADQATAAVRSLLIMRGHTAIRDQVLNIIQRQREQMLSDLESLPAATVHHEIPHRETDVRYHPVAPHLPMWRCRRVSANPLEGF